MPWRGQNDDVVDTNDDSRPGGNDGDKDWLAFLMIILLNSCGLFPFSSESGEGDCWMRFLKKKKKKN